MKRSEMLKIIETALNASGDFPDLESKARYLLGEIEVVGMCPVSEDHKGMLSSLDWEPENE